MKGDLSPGVALTEFHVTKVDTEVTYDVTIAPFLRFLSDPEDDEERVNSFARRELHFQKRRKGMTYLSTQYSLGCRQLTSHFSVFCLSEVVTGTLFPMKASFI